MCIRDSCISATTKYFYVFNYFVYLIFCYLNDEINNNTVSYTHLDVYKRQEYACSRLTLLITITLLTTFVICIERGLYVQINGKEWQCIEEGSCRYGWVKKMHMVTYLHINRLNCYIVSFGEEQIRNN